jgi:cell division protein FtsL
MLKILNAALVIAVLASGYVLYSLEHTMRGEERQIAIAQHGIADTREQIKLLTAEWSSLTRPERLQKLAEDNLALEPTKAQQFVSIEDLKSKVPESVPVKLEATDKDPIGDILKKMQQQ